MTPFQWTADYVLRVTINTLPVIVFLAALMILDSYKLVRPASVLRTILAGMGAAVVAMYVNGAIVRGWSWEVATYSRYVAPPIEETIKGAILVGLIASKRVGFMIDAAIYGFALGTGFAIVENVYYLGILCDATVAMSVLRGFGTALMHGGATALLGIVTKSLTERYGFARAWIFLPGLGIAVVLHSLFNHFPISPAVSALGMVVMLPALMYGVFQQGQGALRRWLGVGFDTDAELLEMIASGGIGGSRMGEYLSSLRDRFPPEVVVDMFNMLRLRVELSIRAKGILLMREAGFEVQPTPDIAEKFEELAFLEKSIGRTGQLAMLPLLHWRERDLWELHLLGRR